MFLFFWLLKVSAEIETKIKIKLAREAQSSPVASLVLLFVFVDIDAKFELRKIENHFGKKYHEVVEHSSEHWTSTRWKDPQTFLKVRIYVDKCSLEIWRIT